MATVKLIIIHVIILPFYCMSECMKRMRCHSCVIVSAGHTTWPMLGFPGFPGLPAYPAEWLCEDLWCVP